MMATDFAHVDTWVFDLDNTLYPPTDRLFDQIEELMRRYMVQVVGLEAARADYLRQHYWRRYGTTLAGLMAEHDVDPEHFMVAVHDIDLGHMRPDLSLRKAIAALPGRRIVYTNGSKPYALRVLAARGLDGLFDAVYGVEHARWVPKPQRAAFETIFAQDGLVPARAAMFEDEVRNLAVPYEMGMRTVHVAPSPAEEAFVHHHTDDLAGFVTQVCS